MRKALGEEHPKFVTSFNNLAGVYESAGRYKEAEPLYKQAMEIRRKTIGEEPPDFAVGCNNLAGLYASTGRYEEAELLFTQALEILTATLGPDHPSTMTVRSNYGLRK